MTLDPQPTSLAIFKENVMRSFYFLVAILGGASWTMADTGPATNRAPALRLDTAQIFSEPPAETCTLAGHCGRGSHFRGGAYYRGGGFYGGYGVGYRGWSGGYYPSCGYTNYRVNYPVYRVAPVYRTSYYRWGCY